MKAEEARERAKARALRLLEKRDYSKAELAAKLVEKGEDPAEAEAVSEAHGGARLCERRKLRRNGRPALRRQGLRPRADTRGTAKKARAPRALGRRALRAAEQADTVERLLAAKLRGRAPEGDDLRRACAALIRRGFSWEEVSSAAKRLSHGLELDE